MKAIKLLRQNKGLTAVQMANKLGMVQTLWSSVENGTRTLPKNAVKKVENFFGFPLEELMKEVDVKILDQAIATAISKK